MPPKNDHYRLGKIEIGKVLLSFGFIAVILFFAVDIHLTNVCKHSDKNSFACRMTASHITDKQDKDNTSGDGFYTLAKITYFFSFL